MRNVGYNLIKRTRDYLRQLYSWNVTFLENMTLECHYMRDRLIRVRRTLFEPIKKVGGNIRSLNIKHNRSHSLVHI